jgi:predicted CXXCH cytochrome family protein
MSLAFVRPFASRADHDGTCMVECHVAGQPGLDDGGFVAVARAMNELSAATTEYAELPPALQRLAGVRCTSCHGPAALPLPAERARILRADVCATCHDAPPAYNHVQAWRSSRMARSDATPATRASLSCARCHTTGGFLHAQGVRVRDDLSRDPDGLAVGISCAACHAPHGEHQDALLRSLPASARGVSALCVQCHQPDLESETPAASTSPLWAGRAQVPQGALLEGPAPHAELPCTACHGARRASFDHSFTVERTVCRGCHGTEPSQDAHLQTRAALILHRLSGPCGIADHAQQAAPTCTGPSAEARYLALLVREDPSAGFHNGPFARTLLERAEQLIDGE